MDGKLTQKDELTNMNEELNSMIEGPTNVAENSTNVEGKSSDAAQEPTNKDENSNSQLRSRSREWDALWEDQIHKLDYKYFEFGTAAYRFQSQSLHISDRFGWFSPGPPREQKKQARKFIKNARTIGIWFACMIFIHFGRMFLRLEFSLVCAWVLWPNFCIHISFLYLEAIKDTRRIAKAHEGLDLDGLAKVYDRIDWEKFHYREGYWELEEFLIPEDI